MRPPTKWLAGAVQGAHPVPAMIAVLLASAVCLPAATASCWPHREAASTGQQDAQRPPRSSAAQPQQPQQPQQSEQQQGTTAGSAGQRPQDATDEGKEIRDVEIQIRRGGTPKAAIERLLKTRTGDRLRRSVVAEDINALWNVLKVRAEVGVRDLDGGVKVIFYVEQEPPFDHTVFKGLDHFTESQVRTMLGLVQNQQLTEWSAKPHQATLEARYRREGYYFVNVRVVADAATSTLTFVVDEGPQVTVRNVHFRGNVAFPGSTILAEDLIGSAQLQSKPAGWLQRGGAYSEEIVQEDLERLRLWLRRKGYRDAEVELADRTFVGSDFSEVDLTFRIIEGRRYTISGVDVEQVPSEGRETPLYPKAEVLEDVELQAGMFYDRELIEHDLRAIERYYGARGHPSEARYPQLQNGFRIEEPLEYFDVDRAEVRIVYRLHEGTPKTLNDVVIRGNDNTQDRVVRRKVFVFPGELLDVTKVERSRLALENLRYFQTPDQLPAVRFDLRPVASQQDVVDLEIDLEEGPTGSFLWGVGVSSDAGVQGNVQLNQRNFDLLRPPTSANPVTIVSEILANEAFHGAGQTLDLSFQPGTRRTLFNMTFYEPDLFGQHFDTIGLRVNGYRLLRLWETFREDTLGARIGLERNFGETLRFSITGVQQTVEIKNVDFNAPTIVQDARGTTEMRGLHVGMRARDVDYYQRPTTGYDVGFGLELLGGPFGAEVDVWKAVVNGEVWVPVYVDTADRAHVVHVEQHFDYVEAFGDSRDVFPTERLYMGGGNLRGFDRRRAGPSQFGQPVGGEARFLASAEYQFPLVSTRPPGSLRERELLRGIMFSDFGLLGLDLNDSTFSEPRLSVGVGLRIEVPQLGIPIALDLGWPLLREETDSRRVFFFSLQY